MGDSCQTVVNRIVAEAWILIVELLPASCTCIVSVQFWPCTPGPHHCAALPAMRHTDPSDGQRHRDLRHRATFHPRHRRPVNHTTARSKGCTSGRQVRRLNTKVSASGDLKSIGSTQIFVKQFRDQSLEAKNCVKSTKGVLASNVSPQTSSAIQALRLLSQHLPYDRRALVGTDKLADPSITVHRRGLPPAVEIVFNMTSTRRGSSSQRGKSSTMPYHRQVGQTRKLSRCVMLKAQGYINNTDLTRKKGQNMDDTKEKMLWCCDDVVCICVCNEVWWCPYPTILRPPSHHNHHHHHTTTTATHHHNTTTPPPQHHNTTTQHNNNTQQHHHHTTTHNNPSLPYTSAEARPMQHRCIGPHTAFSCGEQVPDVAIPHYRDARMQHSQSR